MATQMQAGTAKIYQFPTRGRDGVAAQAARRPSLDGVPVRRPDVGAWYHEAAIRDGGQPRKP